MILLQIEVAKELLNKGDSTVQGVLLGVIVILLCFIGMLWKSKLSDEKYIREQDKANLELLITIVATIKDVGIVSNKNGDKLDNVLAHINLMLSTIKERLKQ